MAKTHPQRRTSRRLARLRAEDPKALSNIKADNRYTPRERRAVRQAVRDLNSRQKSKRETARRKQASEYNPLAPLTGDRARQEEEAATRLEFGDQENELRKAVAAQNQTTVNTGGYYDEYKKALGAAAERVRADNAALTMGMQQRTDTAYAQDKAAVAARDAKAAADAQKFGFASSGASNEGAQAVEAARSQQNQAITTAGTKGNADNKYFEDRAATAVLAKAEALKRENAKSSNLTEEGRKLAQQKGDFRVNFRNKTRESERSYALAQKEFGLKVDELASKNKGAAADRKIETQKVSAQKLIAKLYADANKAKARATIRVAQIQLRKGKIDQKQYRTIRNIYEGLPAKGKSGSTNGSSGSSAGLQNWEKDKVSNALNGLRKNNARPSDKQKWLQRMQDAGLPARLARVAWRRYVNSATGYNKGGGPD